VPPPDSIPEDVEWDGHGPSPAEGSAMGQFKHQKAFLEQVMKLQTEAPPQKTSIAEAAAGLPLEAAQALILLGPETEGLVKVPWQGLPYDLSCLAAASRMFSRLVPSLGEAKCSSLCSALRGSDVPPAIAEVLAAGQSPSSPSGSPLPVDLRHAALETAAVSSGFELQQVSSPIESLKAMLKGKPTACCVLLENYIAVVEDPMTGMEDEKEVGASCILIVGGDLLGPSFVAFDPFGESGGEVNYWSMPDLENSKPAAYLQLSPILP